MPSLPSTRTIQEGRGPCFAGNAGLQASRARNKAAPVCAPYRRENWIPVIPAPRVMLGPWSRSHYETFQFLVLGIAIFIHSFIHLTGTHLISLLPTSSFGPDSTSTQGHFESPEERANICDPRIPLQLASLESLVYLCQKCVPVHLPVST